MFITGIPFAGYDSFLRSQYDLAFPQNWKMGDQNWSPLNRLALRIPTWEMNSLIRREDIRSSPNYQQEEFSAEFDPRAPTEKALEAVRLTCSKAVAEVQAQEDEKAMKVIGDTLLRAEIDEIKEELRKIKAKLDRQSVGRSPRSRC